MGGEQGCDFNCAPRRLRRDVLAVRRLAYVVGIGATLVVLATPWRRQSTPSNFADC